MRQFLILVCFYSFCVNVAYAQSDSVLKQADKAYTESNYQLALSRYTEEIRNNPKNAHAYFWRAQARTKLAENNVDLFESAREDYEQALKLVRSPRNLNGVAWFLATVPEQRLRDGQRAVELASEAGRATKFKSGFYLDTLAAAYAESNDFELAQVFQLAAMQLGIQGLESEMAERLELYRNHKPVVNGYTPKPTSGIVKVNNTTNQTVTFHVVGGTDKNGNPLAKGSSWELAPNRHATLRLDEQSLLDAKHVRYQLHTEHGVMPSPTTSWTATYASGANIDIRISQTNLPVAKRQTTAKVPLPDPDTIRETAETIKSLAEAGQEVRDFLGERPSTIEADLIVSSVRVMSTKSNGKSWDSGNGEPDISVAVRIGRGIIGDSGETATTDDSLSASPNSRVVRVKAGETITVTVWDNDAFNHDMIGEYTKRITAETINQGTAEWSFDRVSSLQVKFEK